jgi:DNA sulfur modification protein DndB
MPNSYAFAAIRGVQAGKAFYVAMVPLKVVGRLFSFDDEDLPVTIRAQRDLNPGRVPAIARYIAHNPGEYILPALTATIDGKFHFEAAAEHGTERSIGTLVVDMASTILINDGQHRRAAIVEALKERPHLGDETIAVTLHPDQGLTRSQQMFVDLNQHGVKPARSLRLVYDARDDTARLTREIVDAVPLLRDMTDFSRSTLPTRSPKLFTFSNLHAACRTLIVEADLDPVQGRPGLVLDFWQAVAAVMPEWQMAHSGRIAAGDLRRDRIHAHGLALEAIAVAGARLMSAKNLDWRTAIARLPLVDWSRSNTRLWEGRALIGGKVNRSRTSVLMTADIIFDVLTGKSDDAASRLG